MASKIDEQLAERDESDNESRKQFSESGYCYYDPVLSPTGETYYVPVVVHMVLAAPFALYATSTGLLSNCLSGALAFQLMKSSSQCGVLLFYSAVEPGLLCWIWQVTVVGAVMTAVVVVHMAAPFW
ncbi:hypothetical protein PRIPAC_85118 [Pristionchus pacificus]|uniref:Uncharacterized protein n=1 Tax=Pristionchus pacificus TaxID=54126 RepID=A0A2A6BU97_PRIPA|nr:hypothetical protein PRIPAC_85118 [Pristionchus pacificus]|eukprot:PDM69475.1 hypothetical protein PRIPAC_44571 [Pristionchus pacificus]